MSPTNDEAESSTGLLDSGAIMQPFLDIMKDSSASKMNVGAFRSLVIKILAHPQIFCGFDEFKRLCLPLLSPEGESVPQSGHQPNASLFNTLDLFSYGNLKDYTNRQETDKKFYLPLNEPALAKLGQLSVMKCIEQACLNGETSISYDSFTELLGTNSSAAMQEDSTPLSEAAIANNREIEDALIRCLYADALKGKLCQKTRTFDWEGESLPMMVSRDVAPDQISDLLSALRGLGQRLEESGKDVAESQEQVTKELEHTAEFWKTFQSQKKQALEDTQAKNTHSGTSSSGGDALSSSLFGGGGQGPGAFSFQGGTAHAGRSQGVDTRRSSKRSRGGMTPGFLVNRS